MKYLRANYFNNDEFINAWNSDDNILFCPTVTNIETENNIVIELHIPGVYDKTLVRGTVLSFRKPIPRRGIRGGALAKIDDIEIDKLEYLKKILQNKDFKQLKRRKHARLSVAINIRFRIIETNDYHEGELLDIAEGGARLKTTTEDLDLTGQKIFLEVIAPGGVRPISFLAIVNNKSKDNLFGVEFLSREKGNFSLLKEFLRRLKSGEFHIPVIFLIFFLFTNSI